MGTMLAPAVFEDQIRPMLAASCLPCHDAGTRTSGLAVTSVDDLLAGGARHGASIVPGHPEKSVLIRALRGELAPQMPMGKPPLPEKQINALAEWIPGYRLPASRQAGNGRAIAPAAGIPMHLFAQTGTAATSRVKVVRAGIAELPSIPRES
ncbi:MAG: hypothetical protein FJW40_06635 [Acidobacteria bacterium]|nr:hypothetical protein [Acidobacteriota bacterium]